MLITIHDYEREALEKLDVLTRDYYYGGSEDESTLRANRAAFEQVRLRPRALVDVSNISLETTILGQTMPMPLLVAPSAYHRLAHDEGECATVRGVSAVNTAMIVSTLGTCSLEEIAAVGSCPLWFQLYVYKDRSVSEQLVRRAEAAGYQALVLTVDTPRLGQRERDLRNGFGLPAHLRMANFSDGSDDLSHTQEEGTSGLAAHAMAMFDASLTWEAVSWLRSITRLPVIVKGIMHGDDAQLAVKHGAAAVIVSNHGGRQLDGALATLEALPEVVAGANGGCEVYVDGGVRRGTEILKCLALGANAVLVGRPVLWGLAVNGADGVQHVLTILRDELERAMALSGVASVKAITPDLVKVKF